MVDAERKNGVLVLTPKRSLDGDVGTAELRRLIMYARMGGETRLVINCRNVTWINAPGAQVLRYARDSFQAGRGEVKLAGLGRDGRNCLGHTTLLEELKLYDNVTKALAAFNGQHPV